MIDLTKVLVDKDNQPIKQNYRTEVVEKGKTVEKSNYRETTLSDVCRIALLKGHGEELIPSLAVARYKLFRKINGNEKAELDQYEKDLLSDLICKSYEVLIAGQAIELIN